MKTNKSAHIVTQLFLQQWKKRGTAEAAFLLTPQECARKFRMHTIKDALSALAFALAGICMIAILLNAFVLKGSWVASIVFGILMFLFMAGFEKMRPGKRAELTTQMHFDWLELSKGLRQYGLLYQDETINEVAFGHLVEEKFRNLIEAIKVAEGREEEKVKARLKARLSSLHSLCRYLNLQIPEYRNLYTGHITVSWIDPRKTYPVLKPSLAVTRP